MDREHNCVELIYNQPNGGTVVDSIGTIRCLEQIIE